MREVKAVFDLILPDSDQMCRLNRHHIPHATSHASFSLDRLSICLLDHRLLHGDLSLNELEDFINESKAISVNLQGFR
jgi:hypothetical protein